MTSVMPPPGTGDSRDDHGIEQVLKLMVRYAPDHQHALQVERLTLLLFGLLSNYHEMNDSERRILRFAAILHDIGWSTSPFPHHKGSMKLILADDTIPISPADRLLVALIARYHRKAHPCESHDGFGSLSSDKKRQVRWSAALLRLSDALDRSHRSLVQTITVHSGEGVIQFCCETVRDNHLGLEGVVLDKKSALLREVSGCQIEVLWN